MVAIVLNNEIIQDALNYFKNQNFEIEYIKENKEYEVFDYNTNTSYTEEELVLQYLRETKRRYNNKVYW